MYGRRHSHRISQTRIGDSCGREHHNHFGRFIGNRHVRQRQKQLQQNLGILFLVEKRRVILEKCGHTKLIMWQHSNHVVTNRSRRM